MIHLLSIPPYYAASQQSQALAHGPRSAAYDASLIRTRKWPLSAAPFLVTWTLASSYLPDPSSSLEQLTARFSTMHPKSYGMQGLIHYCSLSYNTSVCITFEYPHYNTDIAVPIYIALPSVPLEPNRSSTTVGLATYPASPPYLST
jgi:hypothetical protein